MKKRNKMKGFETRLAEAMLLLKKNRFLLFSGPLFSGRSSLAKAIAKCSEPALNLVFLSFDDQVDSKTLFGSYQSSGIPGDFAWEASSFMDALATESTLIIIKSWETANADTQNAVIQLATDGVVILPGNRRVEINPTSRIIGIVSDNGVNRSIPFPLTLKFHHLSKSEILSRLSSCRISGVKLDELYELFIKIKIYIDTLPHSERRLMTRDFFVLCNRLDGESSSITDVFLDVVDVFVSHLSKRSYQEEPLQEIASFLSIASNSVEFIEKERDVSLSFTNDLLTLGRMNLKVERPCLTVSSLLPFAPTRSYRVLMEKIAACVVNKESVLLNGETGIGKTRLVQELAHRLNIPLDTINLSLDSEAADIIGGFKPVNIGVMVKQLLGSFFIFFDGQSKLKEMLMHLLVTKKYQTLLKSMSKIVQISIKNSTGDTFAILSRLLTKVQQLLIFASSGTSNTPFTFVVGILMKAMNEGHWLLLDEINMGTAECLNALSSIISEQLPLAHPNFRLFCCMNPATDTGKKMLPLNVRALFTEFFVHPPRDFSEICEIINQYIVTSKTSDIANFYLNMSSTNSRMFSLRNLCRSLLLIKDDVFRNVEKSTRMALTLGFNDGSEANLNLIQVPLKPLSDELQKKFILVEGVFFPRGPNNIQEDPDYIRTASVQTNVQAIAAAAASGRFPVLLEGETSTGKTTVITHLAKVTGYTVYRINNHEQTDIQEYIGSYVPNKDNKLEFQEGVLLKAVRKGNWVILDELNLAPTEVLEALNRLLDDNRELVVPERDICVKAHPNFRIFATQNPAGLYGGRKKLSRAFLNRFVVIKFDQPPKEELVKIVSMRCAVSESAAKLMIQVMLEMKVRRSNTRLFNSTGLMTLRDLFRWGNRVRLSEDGTDWRQELCNQGFFLLASRNRTVEDSFRVKSILEQVLKRTVDVDKLYSVESPYFPHNLRENCSLRDGFMVLNGSMVLTSSLVRMIVLFNEAAKVNEPILLVGETGCGKTAVTYLMSSGSLEFINCHERTDVSDLLGSIRPASDGLFHWQDGVVIRAMKNGSVLLIDEISLANDSVLERLNSMLEPSRMILLADSGASSVLVTAIDGFKCVATMNPGGDYGKKELSKALRNRFTEIWCSFDPEEGDVLAIIKARFDQSGSLPEDVAKLCGNFLSKYLVEFYSKFGKYLRHKLCVRDVVVVAETLSNFVKTAGIEPSEALYHTISSHVLDSLPIICNGYHIRMVDELTYLGKELFLTIYKAMAATELKISTLETISILQDSEVFKVGPFSVPKGPFPSRSLNEFNINAKSTALNALRVARGFAAGKPIMLEGMPGSGKSSLIGALAQVSGNNLIRLNLSDQIEVTDLFGSDVPITLPDGTVSFTWKDGPILKALKEGSWVLLDEMNLAPQAILEALNSCFDFRKTLYVSELGRSFVIDSEKPARFFACQNPERMGGNRHSLPRSFLNRFVTIFTKDMDDEDFKSIVYFVAEKAGLGQNAEIFIRIHIFCNERISSRKGNGVPGAPLEYNLRDLMRMIDCSKECDILNSLELVYLARLWNMRDRINYRNEISQSVLNMTTIPSPVVLALEDEDLKILEWGFKADFSTDFKPLSSQLKVLQNLIICVKSGLLALLVGPTSCGKEKLVRFTSQLFRTRLNVIKLNGETDAQDLLGSYEHIIDADAVKHCVAHVIHLSNAKKLPDHVNYLVDALKTVENSSEYRTLINLLVKETEGLDIGETLMQISHAISRATLSFDWIDSDFVRAYSEGHWVLIKDVNCCSAAVLDRLNNCLERDGELVLSEKVDGEFRVLKRHPNFRVFLTMRPENGNISSAMRNRTSEIRFDQQECWVSSWVDTLRLFTANMKHLVTQLQSLEEGKFLLRLEKAGFMKTLNLPLSSRLSMLGLTLEDDDCPNFLLMDSVSAFYHISWFLETFTFDRNMICLMARIVGGLSLTYSHILLSSDPQQNFPAEFWEEAFLMDPISDLTVFGAKPSSEGTDRKQYVISHFVSFILSENLKPNHPASLVSTSANLEPKTIPSVLLAVYRPFLDYLQSHKKALDVKFLFFGYIFIKFVKSEWNRDIGEVIGLEILQILHQFCHLEPPESGFLKSLNDVLTMVKVDVDKPSCKFLPNVMPFTTSAQVNAAKARLHSVMVRLDVPDKVMDVLKFEMKILIESLKSVLILNFEHGFLDKYTRMLSCFPIEDRKLLVKMQLVALLRTRVNLGGTNFFISDAIQSDALNPLINLFWKRLGFRSDVNELKVFELANFDDLLKELIDNVSVFTCLIYQVKAKVTDFVNELYPEEDTPSELERVRNVMPVDLIDPVLKQYASKEVNNQLKYVLDTLSEMLRTYGRNVFGSTEDFKMCFTNLSEKSSRFSCDLHCLAQENKKALVELDKLGELVRPPNTKFFQLCRLLEMFMGQMEKFFELGEDKIKLAVFHNAVNRHVDQLTSSFWEYPDVITPYVSAVFELELALILKYSSVDGSVMASLLDGFEWIESTNVDARIDLFSREISSFPLRLQTQMIREALFIERIRPGSTIFMVLDWLKVQWKKWYQSIQKKKADLFEYKTTQMKKRGTEGKPDEDNTQYVDEELIEVEQMLPDFSSKAEVKFTEQMNELNVLSEDEMLDLIKSVLQSEYPLDEINVYGPMLYKSDSSLITLKSANLDVHSAALLQLKNNIAEKNRDGLNVYKHNSPSLLIDCVNKLQKLMDRVNVVNKSFPESNILKNIILSVNSFFGTSSCHPQMMYTSMLEAVLEKAELWESNTCREYSLSDLLVPLKEVILDWRKMEVVCWSDIIRQAQTTSHNNALLSSWPLFEAFTNFEEVSEDYEKKLLVMLIQWLNDSSLNDFVARIETGEMAVAWMERAGKRSMILSKLRSVISYYKQFVDATKERVRPALDEAEEKLQNMVKVARYTDLNLWSVKDSSQRVHNQICRLIHAYKVELNKPSNSIFLNSILPIPKGISNLISNIEWDLLKKRSSEPFTDFIDNLQRILSLSYACEEGHQLIDIAKALFEQIQHDVDYSMAKNICNPDDKEEIERVQQKMFSKEMLKRRRTFADLRKRTINFGFNYRKGLTIDTDRLTELTMTSFDQTSDETLNTSFLLCSSARNVIVKLLAEFNHHQHHHVASQLPVENFNFVKGVVEFGEEGLLALNRSVCDIEKLQKELTLTIDALESLEMVEASGIDYNEIVAVFDKLSASFVVLKRKFVTFSQFLAAKAINIPDHFIQFVPRFLKNGEDYDKLQEVMLEVSTILDGIRLDKESLQRVHASHLVKHFTLIYAKFYSMINRLNTVKELCGDCGNQLFNSLVKFYARLEKLLKIVKQSKTVPIELTFDTKNLMLKSQSIYRYYEKSIDKPYFTKLASFSKYLEDIGINDQIATISKIRNQLYNGYMPRDKIDLLNHLKGFLDVVDRVLDYSKKGSILSSTFFYEFCISAERILKKGFLNPIPNQEKNAGEGVGETSGEPSGMGEGTGQTDVGKDIEETGQVEGLQDDSPTGENDTSEPNKNEAETPLDMDQEFAADMEDLDDEEGGGDNDKDDNGGEDDKEPDWDMGDVMNEEEKEIDPGLWDQEKKNPDNMDDEEQGAQQKTGETVAQAEEASGKESEQDEKVEDDNDNREENHEEIEMENVDAIDLDDEEHTQNEGDEENMDLDSTGYEEEVQKDEMDITETKDPDETDEAATEIEDDEKEKDDKNNEDGEQAQSIETDGKETGRYERDAQETKKSLENQEEEEGLDGERGESRAEGFEKQKKENEGPNDAINDMKDVEINEVNENEEAEKVDQREIVQGEEDDAIDETQKTFAEKSDVDLSSKAHYVQKSTTIEKSKEVVSKMIDNDIRKENQNMGERTREFTAQLEQRRILETFYLNTTVDVGTVIRAQDAIDSLKESMACLDEGDEKQQLEKKWQFISQSVTTHAFELAEALRILVEPTKASKFQGDYRSGKRLNMRRLIPYIASNYQKNKIWMRRKKPAKRTVHVCLAIDDSYSMRENMMTEITCQTVCLLEKAFKQLEIGQVSICKFGMDVEMLCESAELSDMNAVGPSLLKNLQFTQTKTDLQALLVRMGEFFGSSRQVSEASHQLLIIIGDGRGTMVNGSEPIKNQVQHLVNNGVTTLYLIVDNPASSVFSMKVANRVSQKMQLSNYMDLFPFSFYSVVQNAAVIPLAISEALKQWMDALML